MNSEIKKIVTIGGGTGSYTVLLGLKNLQNISITALVSMADDGGSTGVLRDELGVLPPGDVRQCLVALSEHSEIVRELMNYRFAHGSLKGHNFGNVFLASLEKVTGNFIKGVEVASEILKIKGIVVPITDNVAELVIRLADGKLIEGESKINHTEIQNIGLQKIYYKGNVHLNEKAKQAILEADYIILGPGNFFCSLVPNLIVAGFRETINNTKAKLILPINLTNKHGHTLHWNTLDYLREIENYLGRKVDFILINNESPSREQIKNYKLEEGDGVLVRDNLNDPRVIRKSLLSYAIITPQDGDKIANVRSFIRHDSKKLARVLKKIFT